MTKRLQYVTRQSGLTHGGELQSRPKVIIRGQKAVLAGHFGFCLNN